MQHLPDHEANVKRNKNGGAACTPAVGKATRPMKLWPYPIYPGPWAEWLAGQPGTNWGRYEFYLTRRATLRGYQ